MQAVGRILSSAPGKGGQVPLQGPGQRNWRGVLLNHVRVPRALLTYCTTILAATGASMNRTPQACTRLTLESYVQIDPDCVPDPLDLPQTTETDDQVVASWEVAIEWGHTSTLHQTAIRSTSMAAHPVMLRTSIRESATRSIRMWGLCDSFRQRLAVTQTTFKRVHGCSATKQVHVRVCAGLPLAKFGKKQLQRADAQHKLVRKRNLQRQRLPGRKGSAKIFWIIRSTSWPETRWVLLSASMVSQTLARRGVQCMPSGGFSESWPQSLLPTGRPCPSVQKPS